MKKKVILVLSTIVAIEIACIVGICSHDSKAQSIPDVTVREVAPQAVLYTIYRGHYEGVGPYINKLYDLAEEKGLVTVGPYSTGYLNNPLLVSDDHWLIEIRIPVSMDSLKLAGTLGEMTDVKLMPAMKVVAAVKPEGQINPEPVIRGLYALINQRGYRIAGGMWQSVLCNKDSEDYSKMRTEFMIPVL